MASSIPAVLAFCTTLFITVLADDCDEYISSNGLFTKSKDCFYNQFCCGTCDNRYCCSDYLMRLNEDSCMFMKNTVPIAAGGVVVMICFIILLIACCVCPCCCLYKMCRKPRPVMTTTTTTVLTTQYPQQQTSNPPTQYPAFQPVPAPVQPGYGAQPGYGPYQGQPYAPGPPPPYQESVR
ncbi:hypothetical protein AMELA_G00007970 [Ameiurus melas]|uniref:Protein shisa-5 n=1 Tax=Ameiurus melas TaxID=219545 RepID=A0A7J6BGN4_AMEME|nr:hypothetical protein AMELA_G00007970 [Ameiurus melas]